MDVINKGVKITLPYVSLRSAMIHVVDVGNVQLPVTLKNAEKLLQKAQPAVSDCGFHRKEDISRNSSWQIDRTSISFPNSSKFLERNISGWIKLVLSHHQINVQYAEANCSLTRMNLYRSGSHYIRHRHLRQEIGHFGTIILQIPVENGHEGGELEVESQMNRNSPLETLTLDLSSGSDQSFYVNFLNVNCVHEMKPLTRGWRIELAYNILWKPEVATLVLPDISSFLVTLTKMAVELRSWQEKMSEGKPKVMIVGLDHNYDPDCHSFSSLLDQDRQMALLLGSIPFINVYLARLTRKVTGLLCSSLEKFEPDDDVMECDPISSKTSISSATGMKKMRITHSASHWIGVDNCAAQFHNLDIDTQAQFVKPLFEKNRKPDEVENYNQDSKDSITSHYFYQSALILWPKNGSFYMDIHHRPDYLLDQMERGVLPNPLAIVRAMISQSNCTELIIYRLLNICPSLGAKTEALQLLKLMADKSIGVPSEDAAVLISEVECKLIGWPDCEDAINKLLTCQPYQQLCHFATLAKQLFFRNCISGFLSVANQTWNFLMEQFRTTGNFNNHNALISCIQMSVCIEEQSKLVNPSKSEQFLSCFVKLPLIEQCHIIIDLKEIYQKNSTSRHFYLSLCRFVAVTFNTSSYNKSNITDCVVDLLQCFLVLDRHPVNIAEIFIENVCRPNLCENNHLLQKLVASLHSLNLTTRMTNQLLDSRIAELSLLRKPEFTWSMKDVKFPDADKYPQIVEFLESAKQDATFKLDSIESIQQAKDFNVCYFGVMEECVERGYSAMAAPMKKGKTISCVIVKTRHLHMALVQQFDAKMEELKRLKRIRAFYETSHPSYVESELGGSTSQPSQPQSLGVSCGKTKAANPLRIKFKTPKKKTK